MRSYRLRRIIFLTLCCDLGLFSKRLVAPIANLVTDALHIPGGVGTAFSLMFLVVAAMLVPRFGCAALMGLIQSVIALGMGMVGSMGALSPIGYVVPALLIDVLVWVTGRTGLSRTDRAVIVNAAASCCAAFTANLIVFRLWGAVLVLYLSVAATSGAVFGLLASELVRRLTPTIGAAFRQEKEKGERTNENR